MGVKVGLPGAKLAALADYERSPAFSLREKAALRFASSLVRDRAVPDEEWTTLRAHFSEPEVVELIVAIGYQTFASQFAAAFQLAPQGFTDDLPRLPLEGRAGGQHRSRHERRNA